MGNKDRKNTGDWGTTYGEDLKGSRRAEDWTLKSEEKTIDAGEKKKIAAAVDEE
jgi:hypothetical protein